MVATDPRMYKYFSVNNESIYLEMIAATTFIVSKNQKAVKIIKDVVKCALIEDCMGPPNSTTVCICDNLWKGVYANCHRFDQSALALGLAQCSNNLTDYLKFSDRVFIKRIQHRNPRELVNLKKKFPWIKNTVI